jgi:hypothetical protein
MNEQNNGAAVRPRQPAELIDALLKLLAAPRQPDFYADYADLVQALGRDGGGRLGTGHGCTG